MPAPFPGTGRPPRLAETFLDGRVTQHCGDVRAVLASLPADHFDCVVTSPPYWGLRDYGTARWEGGDPDCDHRSPTMREGRNEERAKLKGSAATNSAQLLLATGDRELIEDSWRDSFWGWGPNRDGQNMLGKLWMEVRAELRTAKAA